MRRQQWVEGSNGYSYGSGGSNGQQAIMCIRTSGVEEAGAGGGAPLAVT